jgi:tRNA (adenine22-N1)-methyltransferase
VSDSITFIAAPGLAGVMESDIDTIVLSGMGGETIAGILKDAPWTKNGKRLILQPQSKTSELCIWMRETGYSIRDAVLTHDNGRFYVVIRAEGGISDSILEPELELHARLMHRRDPLYAEYIDELIGITRRAMEGIKDSGTPDILAMALRLSVYISLKEANNKCQA